MREYSKNVKRQKVSDLPIGNYLNISIIDYSNDT